VNHSKKIGVSFGMTSGIITTLGLIVGLHSGTHSKLAVIGGVVIIAIADAFSDGLGIHVSEESETTHSTKEIWESTIFTALSKFFVALSFLVPVMLFELSTAILVSIFWGLLLLGFLSFYLAKIQRIKPAKVIAEHLGIMLIVIVVTHYVGDWVGQTFV
jgi:VIT1/CCC1 family predicted Fe2+/Mn2+ transporter